MYQKIFVPVDDSQASLAALHEACKIAKHAQGVIYMTHVLDLTSFSQGGVGYLQSVVGHEATKAEGEKVLAQAQAIVAEYGLKAEVSILENMGDKVSKLLVNEATKHNCDVIVMGTHGWTGVMHLLMGSVAEGVLRQVDIPVILIRKKSA